MFTILCGNLQVTAYEIIRCLPFFLYQRLIQSIIDLAGSMESWRFTDGNKRWHCTSGLISNLLLSAKKYVLGRDALLHISVPLSACKEWLNHGQVQVPFTFYMALPTRDMSVRVFQDCVIAFVQPRRLRWLRWKQKSLLLLVDHTEISLSFTYRLAYSHPWIRTDESNTAKAKWYTCSSCLSHPCSVTSPVLQEMESRLSAVCAWWRWQARHWFVYIQQFFAGTSSLTLPVATDILGSRLLKKDRDLGAEVNLKKVSESQCSVPVLQVWRREGQRSDFDLSNSMCWAYDKGHLLPVVMVNSSHDCWYCQKLWQFSVLSETPCLFSRWFFWCESITPCEDLSQEQLVVTRGWDFQVPAKHWYLAQMNPPY